ncbi:MAG: hypothetical protein MK102_06580 [Fuerstiella sp.]|nr:hypothetical protein [Fuerstiella sp.]
MPFFIAHLTRRQTTSRWLVDNTTAQRPLDVGGVLADHQYGTGSIANQNRPQDQLPPYQQIGNIGDRTRPQLIVARDECVSPDRKKQGKRHGETDCFRIQRRIPGLLHACDSRIFRPSGPVQRGDRPFPPIRS